MQRKKQISLIWKAAKLLKNQGKSVCNSSVRFGYRERLKIERALFLLVKSICSKKLGYSIQGMCSFHKKKLLKKMARKQNNLLIILLNQIFDLKIFIQKLGSDNAYVRGDIISQEISTKYGSKDFIKINIESIMKKIKLIDV
ncbi:MAG: hypothetical protein KKD05_06485 [Candidatus Omnitrophica bacterium]|nr:hypothetical protein [Candidatus Omnitrophota bacterium]